MKRQGLGMRTPGGAMDVHWRLHLNSKVDHQQEEDKLANQPSWLPDEPAGAHPVLPQASPSGFQDGEKGLNLAPCCQVHWQTSQDLHSAAKLSRRTYSPLWCWQMEVLWSLLLPCHPCSPRLNTCQVHARRPTWPSCCAQDQCTTHHLKVLPSRT